MTDNDTLTYLKSERTRRPELADALDLHIAILEARAGFKMRDAGYGLRAEDARARLERSEPILRAEDLALDWNAFARLFQTICRIAARYRPDDAAAFAAIAREAESPARAQELARENVAGARHASPDTPHASLVTFVLNNALHPFLAASARQLSSRVDDAAWYRGYCPICGGEPDFAALEKEGGARRLLCSRCDHVWTFHRARCPFCGEDAPGKLGYYPGKDGAYRLYACENCKRYLKTIDLRELARAANLPAERVLTIGMDAAAHEAGYR